MIGRWVLFSFAFVAGAGFLRLGNGGNQGPIFVKEPPDRVDFSNMTGATLDCAATGKPEPKLTWTRADESLVTDVPRLREVAPNGTLMFKPFKAEDYRQDVHTAIYKCVASNPTGSIVSRDVRVRAVVKQFYKVQVYDEFVIKGNIAVLKCHVPSFVKDYINVTSWLKDDVDIHAYPEAKRFVRLSTGELYIYDVSMEDGSRTYRCKTRHKLTGEVVLSSSGRLIVTDPKSSVPPRISHSVGNVVSRVGQNIEIPCAAQAYPAPTYRWFRAVKKQLVPVQSNQDRVLLDGQLMLRHSQVQDGGKYVCVISNTVGEERVESTLTISAPLTAHVEPEEQEIDVGKSASFHCVITGHPVTSVTWFRNGRPLPTDGGDAATFPAKEKLLLQAVQREDRGMYQCFVQNDEETAQAAAELKLGDAAPVFYQTFSENTLNPGPSVSLQCAASGNPTPTFTWTLDGQPLPESKRFQISEQSESAGDMISQVNITRLKVEDGGEYKCIASNRVGSTHHTARLNVYGIPYIRPIPNITVVAGLDVTIPCRVAGHPIRLIRWERDGTPFPANLRHKAFPNGTLVIQKAELVADKGSYTCVASSEYGQTARRSVWVNIMDPPKIDPFSFPRDLSEDMRARILCTIIRGDLPITITWMKDNFHVSEDMGILVHNADEFSSSLTFRSVTAAHRGNYTCIASNAASTVNYTAELFVHVPPRWSVEPSDTQVMYGTVAVLDCQADGFPTPNVTWLFGGVKMPSDFTTIEKGNFRFRLASNNSLLIEGVRKQDEGYYLCQATNGIGSGISKPVFLTVNAPPQFSVKHKTQAARRGDDVSLHCDVRGDYPMEVTWRRNKQRIYPMDDHRFRIKEKAMDSSILSELMIVHAERKDALSYSCQAQNAFGQDEATIQLLVQEPPSAPSDVKIISQSSRVIKFSWKPGFDGHSAITTYHVQYKLAGESWSADAQTVSFSSESTASVTNLLPGMTYHFRVMAENSLGRSDPTEIVEASMPEEAPGGPPLAIEVKPTGSASLRVTWRPPKKELTNGEILGYYVGYKIYETSEPYHYRTVEMRPEFKEELQLTDLRKYTKYSVVVQAYNRMGSGPYSDEVVAFTLEDTPSEPPQKVQCSSLTSQSLQVGWEPPPKSAQNGVIRGYKLLYKATDEFYDDAEYRSTSVSTLKTKLHGLDMYHNYSIETLAFTRAGDGVRSDAIYCRTLEDVPGSPRDLKAMAMSSDAILVTWRPPKNPNGHITKYVVYVRALTKEEQPPTKHTVPFGSQSYLEIRNLKENQDYEFWVTAFTAIGEGESTKVVKQTPKSRVPARLAAFSETIKVAWREDVRLSCRTVGIPTPKRIWKINDSILQSNERMEIYPNGSLLIRNAKSNDSGNFSCSVENIYGHDSVQYTLGVQAPPVAPVLFVVATTESSIHLKWTHQKEDGTKVKGYTLSFKREYGEWEEVDIGPEEDSYHLNSLHCGSKYQFYITAFNKVGSGEPSVIVTNNTKGAAPRVAKQSNVLVINSTFVTLLLDNWPDGGCSILYYVVQYSLKSPVQWMLVSNNVQPKQRELSILDLLPGTWYTLRVMAHNDAGSTLTELDFATLANDGSVVMAGMPTRARDVMRTFYTDPHIVIPIVVSIFILFGIAAMVWLFIRQKKMKRDYHHRENYNEQEAKQLNLDNERKIFLPDKEIMSQANAVELNYDPATLTRRFHPVNVRTPTRSTDNMQGFPDDICPYATFSLEDCRVDGQDSQEVPLRFFSRQDSCERYRQANHHGGSVKSDTYARIKRHNHIHNDNLAQIQHNYTENPDIQTNVPTTRTNSCKRRDKRSRKRSTRVKPSSTEYDSVQSDSEPSELEGPYYPNSMAHENRNRVPDLIYHTTDSSTSNPSSPDEKRPSQRLPLHRSYGPPDAVLPLASDREHWWNPIYKMNEFPVTTVPSPSNQDTTLLTTDHYHQGYGMEYAPDAHLDLLYQNEPTPPVKRKLPHVLDPHFTEGCTLKL